MLKYYKKIKKQNGMIATLALLGVSAVTLAIVSSATVLAMGEFKMAYSGSGAIEQTYYAAEAGLNEALYRLIESPTIGNYSFDFDGIIVEITVSSNPDNPYQRIIRSQATDPSGKVRIIEIIANTNSFGAGFDYAVQGGTGGIYLDNNSQITGNVYCNGDILPASGGATGNISGHVTVADANIIDKVNVGGDVYANTITRSDIAGHAYYQSIDTNTDVGGSPCNPVPHAECTPGSPDKLPKDFPIDDTDAQAWKDDITALGNPVLGENPADCPPARSSGYYCVTNNTTLGFQKIDSNFYIGNGASLTLTGNIWVTGDIILDNNGTIQVDPSLGGGSVVIISDGIIDVNNNYTISGSGDPRSFILMISLNSSMDPNLPAVYASNNSDSIVFAAIHGMLKVKNNGRLNAAAAESIYLEPNSEVIYNPLLMAFSIPSGGGNEVGTALGTWQEL